MEEEIYHLEAWFTGRVQGVGFRYTTMYIAKGYEVCGTVKNLRDGRVYLVAEGEQKEVDDFVNHVKEDMASYIKETEVETKTCERNLRKFDISY